MKKIIKPYLNIGLHESWMALCKNVDIKEGWKKTLSQVPTEKKITDYTILFERSIKMKRKKNTQ